MEKDTAEQLVGQVVGQTKEKIYVATKIPPENLTWPALPGNRDRREQLHGWNPEWIDRDEWKRGFEDLKRSGKEQAVGILIIDHQPDSALEIIKTGLIYNVVRSVAGPQHRGAGAGSAG